jgi:3-oxoacyl-[acyl-carrier-protein] synthase-3
MTTAASLVGSGTHNRVMVIGSDTMSRIIDYTDRATCILFGDGAGAFIIEPAAESEVGYVGHKNMIDGSGAPVLRMPAGGSRMPPTHETVEQRLHYVKQEGQAVFKFAVKHMGDISAELLEEHGMKTEDVAVMIPHQANLRIISACAHRLGMSMDRVMVNIERYGNTTSGTLGLATRDAVDQGLLKKGDYVLFAAVGAGFTVGANLWRWEI